MKGLRSYRTRKENMEKIFNLAANMKQTEIVLMQCCIHSHSPYTYQIFTGLNVFWIVGTEVFKYVINSSK